MFLNGLWETWEYSLEAFGRQFQSTHTTATKEPYDGLFIVDGGANHISKMTTITQVPLISWVGDADSILSSDKEKIKELSHEWQELCPQKDLSDFAKALDILGTRFPLDNIFLEIYGGLGKRRSHERANLEEVSYFIKNHKGKVVCLFHKGIILANSDILYHGVKGENITILSQDQIEILGCEYTGKFQLQRPSHGLSNKINNPPAQIKPHGELITIYIEQEEASFHKSYTQT